LPEVSSIGYIADLVAVVGMHNQYHTRYARHSGLEKKYAKLRNPYREYEEHGDIDRWYVCVFEAKATRADFLNTFNGKKTPHSEARLTPVGTAHWVVAEKGVCRPEELPDFWGLLVPYGAGLSEKKLPKLNVLSDSSLHTIAFDMMWLQMNFRRSFYDQIQRMSERIEKVHRAILMDRSKKELLQLSEKAVKACEGFV